MPISEELLQIRIPREVWARLERRSREEGLTRSAIARQVLADGLDLLDYVDLDEDQDDEASDGYVQSMVPARAAVLAQVDALVDVLDAVEVRNPKEAVRLAVETTITFNRWATLKARALGMPAEEIWLERGQPS